MAKPSIEMKTASADVPPWSPARTIAQYVATVRTVTERVKVTQCGDSASMAPKHPQPGAAERHALRDAATNKIDDATAARAPIQRPGERSRVAPGSRLSQGQLLSNVERELAEALTEEMPQEVQAARALQSRSARNNR